MSNFDKFDNFMKIIEKYKTAHTPVTAENFAGQIDGVTTGVTKSDARNTNLYKYCAKISKYIKGIKKNNG